MVLLNRFIQRLVRRKPIDLSTVNQSPLARVLTLLDLTALGIGSTLGAGIYVVAGQVARETAGPSVVLSFFIAAVASVMAGLCYAEFGSRVPKTGSAYVYSYVTVGELAAFVIGWNLILEYVIGTASVARAWSANFDSLINNTIQNFFEEHLPLKVAGLSPYPDFFSFGITLLLTVILAVGVKESTTFNNIFTGVNLLVVLYVIICGLFKVDINNWYLSKTDLPSNNKFGDGGFFPFGFGGMMSGAATCFYAFVGFDCIATTGEEAIRPERNIPLSIILSLLAIFIGYFGIASVLTLMCPYFLLDAQAPLPEAFDRVGWGVAKYIIAVGAVCGLSTSLLGAMFPMPRVIYAMAGDGVIFRFLSTINKRFKTPLVATILSGFLAGVMAMLFDLKELVDMMSIGTLLAYTLVAVSVLIIRYRVHVVVPEHPQSQLPPIPAFETSPLYMEESSLPGAGTKRDEDENGEDTAPGSASFDNHVQTKDVSSEEMYRDSQCLLPAAQDSPLQYESSNLLKRLFRPLAADPTQQTQKLVIYCVGIVSAIIIVFNTLIIYLEAYLVKKSFWAIILVAVVGLTAILMVVIIACQPQNKAKVNFKVPFLPVLPVISTFVNIYLMLKLSAATWIRFGVWMALGFVMYFSYGICHSSLSHPTPAAFYQFTLLDSGTDSEEEVEEQKLN
ncbi:high affinity cationic amino acid transporter 1-like isoform X2 [Liolophura sinensis]|uniref:high affinity cationic amino acid transporter 1-like isoform X2 n=1 Tax=Liolophura sinensis TaxID=3198878 RepID=UPI003158946C